MEFLRSMGMTRSPIAEKGNNRGKARATHSPGYEAALSEAMALPGEPSQDTCLEPLHPDVA